MTKEEFICASLPYKLEMQWNHYAKSVCTVEGIDVENRLFKTRDVDGGEDWYSIDQFSPILHPISDLVKPIWHKGKEVIPIVELVRIAAPDLKKEIKDTYVLNGHCGCNFTNEYYLYSFDYWYENITFSLENNDYDGNIQEVNNQFQLFQMMLEWHFDIAGLIEKGEAIDVNTLETNPYK